MVYLGANKLILTSHAFLDVPSPAARITHLLRMPLPQHCIMLEGKPRQIFTVAKF